MALIILPAECSDSLYAVGPVETCPGRASSNAGRAGVRRPDGERQGFETRLLRDRRASPESERGGRRMKLKGVGGAGGKELKGTRSREAGIGWLCLCLSFSVVLLRGEEAGGGRVESGYWEVIKYNQSSTTPTACAKCNVQCTIWDLQAQLQR